MYVAQYLFIVPLGYALCYQVYENVVFQKTNEITTTHARWLLTIVHDLKPYARFIEQISNDIDQVQSVLDGVAGSYNQSKNFGYSVTLTSLSKEIDLLREVHNGLLMSFENYQSITFKQRRSKRSLIPLIGQAFSFLFGTVSETDLRSLKKNVKDLAENQRDIAHYLDESMSLINSSIADIAINRRSITDIAKTLQRFDLNIREIKEAFEKRVYELERFVNAYQQFTLIIEEVKKATQRAVMYLENLRIQLNMLSLNHLSPSAISPEIMIRLLSEIQVKLPNSLKVPSDPDEDIWFFYRTLSCTAVIEDSNVLMVITVPLVDYKEKNDVYYVHNLPFPYHDGKTQGNERTELPTVTAKYDIEGQSLLANKDRTLFTILSQVEFQQCINRYLGFCSPQSAMYPINLSQLCMIALFMQRKDSVQSYCNIIVSTNANLPIASHLGNGIWVIASNRDISMNVICQEGTRKINKVIYVQAPLQLIRLNSSCHASSDYLLIPLFSEHTSKYPYEDPLKDLINPRKISNISLWKGFGKQLKNNTSMRLPKSLSSLKDISMPLFIKRVHELRYIKRESKTTFEKWIYLFISGSISMCISVLIVIIWQLAVYLKNRKISRYCCGNKEKHADCSQLPVSNLDGTVVTTSKRVESSARQVNGDTHNELCRLYPKLCSLNTDGNEQMQTQRNLQ